MESFEITLHGDPTRSQVIMDGKRLTSVVRVDVWQQVDDRPMVVLQLKPEAVTLKGEARAIRRFDRSAGWDPWDGLYG